MKTVKLFSLTLVLLLLVGLAIRYGGGFKFSFRWLPGGVAPAAASSGLGDVGPVVKLEPFLVSGWRGDSLHTTTITFEVEVSDDQSRDAMKARNSQIRSAILGALADVNLDDMGDPADYRNLKLNVQEKIQALLPNHQVRHVFITQFLTY
jgi:flagellar basal body-associated protein FliL